MSNIRPAAVAGMFYPDDETSLKGMVQQFLVQATSSGPTPKAIIVPHAGYVYSGPIAANAYHLLENNSENISRVILLGPSHRVPLLGLAATSASSFATPLGLVEIDQDMVKKLCKLKQVKLMDEAHSMEHSLEVQLPFLQTILTNFKLIPLVAGDASAREVCEVLELACQDDTRNQQTLIVISSDLSHYHDYATANRLDTLTSKAIENLDGNQIGYEGACGRTPVNGLLMYASRHGLKAEIIDQRNSGDTAGDKGQVVGYGAYAFR